MPYLIVENTTNIIKYASESEPTIEDNQIVFPTFTVLDMNNNNSSLINTATELPEDYIGCKYKWESSNYVINPDYIEPE